MIQTSIGTLQVGSPWLARQWINSIPGIVATPGITQNNLTIRAGNKRPSFTTAQGAAIATSSSGGGGSSGGSGGGTSGGGGSSGGGGIGGGGIIIDDGGDGGGSGGDGGGFTYL